MPDVGTMSERVKVCLQETDEVPRDFTSLFDLSMYKMDTSVLPDVIKYIYVCVCVWCSVVYVHVLCVRPHIVGFLVANMVIGNTSALLVNKRGLHYHT